MTEFNNALRGKHGDTARLDELDEETQDDFLTSQEQTPLFNMVRTMTIFGFFAMEKYGGNKGKVGWDLLGFDGNHGPWTYPFGYYDAEVHGGTNDGE